LSDLEDPTKGVRSSIAGSASGGKPVASGVASAPGSDELQRLIRQLLNLLKSSPAHLQAVAPAAANRQLVYVHGICRHSHGFSDPWWEAMSPFVPSLQPGTLDGNRHEVLWSDLVVSLRAATALIGGEQAKARDRIVATLKDRLERQIHDTTPQARGLEKPRAVSLAQSLPAVPGLDCINDFTTYLFNESIRSQILGRFQAVVRPLLQSGAQVEIISHSWGTVVAYEALRQMDSDPQLPAGGVLNFFTVGSALSIFEVQQGLLPTSSGGLRPRVVARWVNLNAHGDIVGGRLQDKPFQVDEEFLNLEPVTCGSLLGIVNPTCAHGSYFQPENLAVNRDILGALIES
jgi:metacaspase-1